MALLLKDLDIDSAELLNNCLDHMVQADRVLHHFVPCSWWGGFGVQYESFIARYSLWCFYSHDSGMECQGVRLDSVLLEKVIAWHFHYMNVSYMPLNNPCLNIFF